MQKLMRNAKPETLKDHDSRPKLPIILPNDIVRLRKMKDTLLIRFFVLELVPIGIAVALISSDCVSVSIYPMVFISVAITAFVNVGLSIRDNAVLGRNWEGFKGFAVYERKNSKWEFFIWIIFHMLFGMAFLIGAMLAFVRS